MATKKSKKLEQQADVILSTSAKHLEIAAEIKAAHAAKREALRQRERAKHPNCLIVYGPLFPARNKPKNLRRGAGA